MKTPCIFKLPSLAAFTAGLFLLLLGAAETAQAQSKMLQNLDRSGTALQGYDPVAYFTDGKPVKGDPNISAVVHGAHYYFASADHKATFEKNPAKYEPQFGGYCAYGVTKGKAVPIKVDAFQIVNDRLLLQYDKGIRDDFNKDTQGNLKTADEKWPEVVRKNAK